MNRSPRRLISLLALALAISACGSGSPSTVGDERSFVSGDGTVTLLSLAERRPAPDLRGPTLDGTAFDSASTKDRIVVLNLWASWCAPCRAEAPTLERLAQEYQDQGVDFVGLLTRDNVSSARAFVTRYGLSFPTINNEPLILDFHGTLPPNAIPTTVVIDRQGRVAARLSGAVTDASLSGVIKQILQEQR
jgi:thiol-disulfide isomerase/thioredoxin